MKELISSQSVEKAFLFVAVVGPLTGMILGIVFGSHQRRAWPSVLEGMLIGGVGTLVYGMWRLYNAITNAMGLDSVANLVLQLIMFAALGAALGMAMMRIRVFLRKPRSENG